MKILFSDLPKFNWWETGVPFYENNLAMKIANESKIIPDQKKVLQEYNNCLTALKTNTSLIVKAFPPELDANALNKHDAIFVRDSFISNQKGTFVISNFSEKDRLPESIAMKDYLLQKEYTVHTLSDNAYAEGGEFYYVLQDNILFAGVSRNNLLGIHETAKYLEVKTLVIIESDCFHLDTICTIMLDKKGYLCGIIACLELIKNKEELMNFVKDRHIPLITIQQIDAIGYDGKGKISVNCLAVPGILIGGNKFITPGVEEKIQALEIKHVVTPITQFLYSGGGVHCLTNELSFK